MKKKSPSLAVFRLKDFQRQQTLQDAIQSFISRHPLKGQNRTDERQRIFFTEKSSRRIKRKKYDTKKTDSSERIKSSALSCARTHSFGKRQPLSTQSRTTRAFEVNDMGESITRRTRAQRHASESLRHILPLGVRKGKNRIKCVPIFGPPLAHGKRPLLTSPSLRKRLFPQVAVLPNPPRCRRRR